VPVKVSRNGRRDTNLFIANSSGADRRSSCSLTGSRRCYSFCQHYTVNEFGEWMCRLSLWTNTISEYSNYEQKHHKDCGLALGVNKRTNWFTSPAKQTDIPRTKDCMFTISGAQTERRASQVSFCQEELFWHKGGSRCGRSVGATVQGSTRGSCDFTDTSIVLLILLITEVATLDVAELVGSFHFTRSPPSLPFTHMVTKTAWFSLCIFSFVPYILTLLHVTTSTAIKAVDDNQAAN